ncbi:hypothetical protein BT93_I0793 [Corymbia citriodora subsp. variegata]|nr:hypothetical protein BT93_I0793 [Corymbia citriodora subsp. variegata]
MPMPWFLITLVLLSSRISDVSEAAHEGKVPSAVVVGTVFCDTCFKQEFSRTSHFISGAYVLIECGNSSSSLSFRQEARTNKHGKFKVHLPPSMGNDVERIEECGVKLIKSGDPGCRAMSLDISSSLRLKSKRNGLRVFSAGLLAFKPPKQPSRCSEGPASGDPQFGSKKNLMPSKALLPPIPGLTPPSFPFPFPSLPPLIPLPPIPFLTPPSPLIPLPPIPGLTPPPSPFIPLPPIPIPGLTPPPPPLFPFPIPPLPPFLPIPGFTPPSPPPPSFPFPPLPPLPPLPPISLPPLPGFTPPPPPLPSPPPPLPFFHIPPLPPLFPFPPPPHSPDKALASTLPEKTSP